MKTRLRKILVINSFIFTVIMVSWSLPASLLAEAPEDQPVTEVPTPTASGDNASEKKAGVSLSLQKQATNPIPVVLQFHIINTFIPSTYQMNGYANQLVLEPVFPIPLKNFPDIIIRPTLPALVTTPDGTNGLGDLMVLQAFLLPPGGNWGNWGVGPALVFPTATNEMTGQGKWQAGAMAVVLVEKFGNWQFGVLTYNLTSFAGDGSRPNVNTLFIQPILNYNFPGGWFFGWGDISLTFNWENGGAATIPLSIGGGRVFEIGPQPVSLSLTPFYTPVHDGPVPQWGFEFTWAFLFPQKK